MDYKYRITTFKGQQGGENRRRSRPTPRRKTRVFTLKIEAKYRGGGFDKIYLDEITNNGEIAKRECYTLFNMRWGEWLPTSTLKRKEKQNNGKLKI